MHPVTLEDSPLAGEPFIPSSRHETWSLVLLVYHRPQSWALYSGAAPEESQECYWHFERVYSAEQLQLIGA